MKEHEEMPKLVTIAQFAEQSAICTKTAYRIVKQMPEHIKVQMGAQIRLLAEPLEEWLKAGGTRGEGSHE